MANAVEIYEQAEIWLEKFKKYYNEFDQLIVEANKTSLDDVEDCVTNIFYELDMMVFKLKNIIEGIDEQGGAARVDYDAQCEAYGKE